MVILGGIMKEKSKDYLFILIGTLILAIGLNCFLVPVKLSPGGIGTIATVLYYFLELPLSFTNIVLNTVLFAFSFKVLEREAVIKTLVGMTALSVFLEITSLFEMPKAGVLIASIFGGTLVGLGVGLIIRYGGSSGGSDFLGLMIKKRVPFFSVAMIILIIDLIIIFISGFLFNDFKITFYSTICMLFSYKASDLIISFN